MFRFKAGFYPLVIVSVLIIILIGFTYYQQKETNPKYQLDQLPKIELSALPEDIYQSLTEMEELAIQKQREVNKNGSFRLDFLHLSADKPISSSTPLILQTYYDGSKKMVQWVTSMPSAFIGLSTEDLTSISKQWEVQQYNPGRALILYRNVGDLAPEDKNTMHLGIKDGKIAIFYGKSGDEFLKQKTDINIGDLPFDERLRLEEGIIVNSQEELLTILEGLNSYKED